MLEWLATQIFGAIPKGIRWLGKHHLLDHRTITGGDYRSNLGARRWIYTVAACAPSTRFRRKRPVSAARALALLNDVIPGAYANPPAESRANVVTFETPDDLGSRSNFEPMYGGRVWSSGLVELIVRIPVEVDANGTLTVPVVDAAFPWYQLAEAVKRGSYRRTYGLWTRARRLDWFVSVGNALMNETGQHPWNDLDFPGERPGERATRGYPASPDDGLARLALRGRRQRADPDGLVAAALRDLLIESGWTTGIESPIEETIAAVNNRRPTPETEDPSLPPREPS